MAHVDRRLGGGVQQATLPSLKMEYCVGLRRIAMRREVSRKWLPKGGWPGPRDHDVKTTQLVATPVVAGYKSRGRHPIRTTGELGVAGTAAGESASSTRSLYIIR